MDTLPAEVIINCFTCTFGFTSVTPAPTNRSIVLEPFEVVTLQRVCKKFLDIGRDDTFWREHCFRTSAFLKSLRRRRELLNTDSPQEPQFRDLARALAHGNGVGDSRLAEPRQEARDIKERSNEKIRILANWDPSYPNEKVSWYDEYIARNGPIQTSWLEQPRHRESAQHEHLEIRGMGLYTEQGDSDSTLVVAPLDDGSVCIWDIEGTKGRKGSIIARSRSGILFPDNARLDKATNHSKLISPGVTECVSIDNARKKAYIAVQSGMFNQLFSLYGGLCDKGVSNHQQLPMLETSPPTPSCEFNTFAW